MTSNYTNFLTADIDAKERRHLARANLDVSGKAIVSKRYDRKATTAHLRSDYENRDFLQMTGQMSARERMVLEIRMGGKRKVSELTVKERQARADRQERAARREEKRKNQQKIEELEKRKKKVRFITIRNAVTSSASIGNKFDISSLLRRECDMSGLEFWGVKPRGMGIVLRSKDLFIDSDIVNSVANAIHFTGEEYDGDYVLMKVGASYLCIIEPIVDNGNWGKYEDFGATDREVIQVAFNLDADNVLRTNIKMDDDTSSDEVSSDGVGWGDDDEDDSDLDDESSDDGEDDPNSDGSSSESRSDEGTLTTPVKIPVMDIDDYFEDMFLDQAVLWTMSRDLSATLNVPPIRIRRKVTPSLGLLKNTKTGKLRIYHAKGDTLVDHYQAGGAFIPSITRYAIFDGLIGVNDEELVSRVMGDRYAVYVDRGVLVVKARWENGRTYFMECVCPNCGVENQLRQGTSRYPVPDKVCGNCESSLRIKAARRVFDSIINNYTLSKDPAFTDKLALYMVGGMLSPARLKRLFDQMVTFYSEPGPDGLPRGVHRLVFDAVELSYFDKVCPNGMADISEFAWGRLWELGLIDPGWALTTREEPETEEMDFTVLPDWNNPTNDPFSFDWADSVGVGEDSFATTGQ
jgi:hypothetical protein